jgi:hypothetical protein
VLGFIGDIADSLLPKIYKRKRTLKL